MKKRGFTLIELLAVIVILAIIALIATPIVMNLIENSKRGAAERTAENIEKAAELYYYENRLDGLFPGITFTCNNENCSSNDKVLQINGKVPEVGSITIDKEGKISLNSIVINGYNCYKENESYKCDKVTKEIASSTNGMLTIDSKGAELLNYKIYGNADGIGNYNSTIQLYEIPVIVIGKNLFDVSKVYTDSHYINNGDGTITVSFYGISHSSYFRGICAMLKPGAEVTLSAVGDGVNGIYLTSGVFWYFNTSKIITEDILNSDFVFYPKKVDGVYVPTTFSNIQIEYGSTATPYEPYKEEITNIYLDEPLRCIGDVCDYIDYNSGKVVRNVGVESDGTLVELKESISQDIDLPNIKLNKGINNIFVETDITPSKIEVEYYK